MKIIFWISLTLILYVYAVYPVLIHVLSIFYKKPASRHYPFPIVSVIVAAYNEEKYIARKIESLRSLEYPENRLEILIGSDGSTDKTDEIVLACNDERVRFFRQPERKGKPSMLNMLIKEAKGEIVVFTDARQQLDSHAADELVKNFSDPKVGTVSGELLYVDEKGHAPHAGIGLYWEYEKWIRKSESRMGSMLGATGALYAARRELVPTLPEDLILDDVYIPLKIVEKGFRAIFDKKAKVYDVAFNNPREEFARKVRTLAGNFQLFFYLRELFNPLRGKISWQFFSHKFLRLTVSFLLPVLFFSNLALAGAPLYRILMILQALFYSMAVIGALTKSKNRLFAIPHMFCVMNAATVAGLMQFCSGKQHVLWKKAVP